MKTNRLYYSFFVLLSLVATAPVLGEVPTENSWQKLVSMLGAEEYDTLAETIRFPLESNLSVTPGWESITTEGGFSARKEKLIPKGALEFLRRQSAEDIFQDSNLVPIQGEPRWRVIWNDEVEEFSLIYSFVVAEDGDVRLVAIDGAG